VSFAQILLTIAYFLYYSWLHTCKISLIYLKRQVSY